MKEGYYWVSWSGQEPEIMWYVAGSWHDFGDDPGAVPSEDLRVLKGPLRAPTLTVKELAE